MKYLVKFEGTLVGTRNSDRTYTHAVVNKVEATGALHVWTFHGTHALAIKEAAGSPHLHVVAVETDGKVKAPRTHAIVSTNPAYISATTGRRMAVKFYTSEKLALKAMTKIDPERYAVEAL